MLTFNGDAGACVVIDSGSVCRVIATRHDRRIKSPYYKETHFRFRDKIRAFIQREVAPFVHEWDEQGTYPRELHEKAYKAGVLGAMWPKEYGA